jgi:hypothetical protein
VLDVVERQPRRGAADRPEVEATVLAAGVRDRLDRLPLASITYDPPASWNWST